VELRGDVARHLARVALTFAEATADEFGTQPVNRQVAKTPRDFTWVSEVARKNAAPTRLPGQKTNRQVAKTPRRLSPAEAPPGPREARPEDRLRTQRRMTARERAQFFLARHRRFLLRASTLPILGVLASWRLGGYQNWSFGVHLSEFDH
jgi:acyl transferase domain-containing protein